MIMYKFHFVGLQVLLLAYTAQSVVLLTANMEDIKKIAGRFVSEPLADKIAEFIAHVTQNMVNNASENEVNDVTSFSEENRNYKLRNKAKIEETGATKLDYHNKYNAAKNSVPTDIKTNNWKVKKYLTHDISSEEPEQDRRYPKKYERKPTRYGKQKQKKKSTDEIQYKKYYKFKKNKPQLHNNDRSVKDPPEKNLKANKYRGFKITADSDETEPDSDVTQDEDEKALRGGNAYTGDITTVKEKTEFDQYDKPKYPKAEFIATSGPVLLPKVKEDMPWWISLTF